MSRKKVSIVQDLKIQKLHLKKVKIQFNRLHVFRFLISVNTVAFLIKILKQQKMLKFLKVQNHNKIGNHHNFV